MKIVKLTASNIKRLSAVEITPDGAVVKISGKNGHGKTSVLDAIWWAMEGAQNVQAVPIRKGAIAGSIKLDLGDLLVERVFTEKGTQLLVKNKDGAKYPSPQAVLDKLIGELSFDPMQFMRLKPREQFERLRTVVSISNELDRLDDLRKAVFDKRTEVNRTVRDTEALVNANPVDESAPDDVVSANDILAKIRETTEANAELKEVLDKRKQAGEKADQYREQIKELQEKLGKCTKYLGDTISYCDTELVDTAPLYAELDTVEAKNDAARAKATAKENAAHLISHKARAQELTDKLADIDQQKATLMSEAAFPLEGLTFADGGVLYNDLPLDQASAAEQLRVSMAIAMATNPKFRVIRITDGSLMDSSSFQILQDIAEANDYQVWVEVVDESGTVGVVIEDGHVVKVNA